MTAQAPTSGGVRTTANIGRDEDVCGEVTVDDVDEPDNEPKARQGTVTRCGHKDGSREDP